MVYGKSLLKIRGVKAPVGSNPTLSARGLRCRFESYMAPKGVVSVMVARKPFGSVCIGSQAFFIRKSMTVRFCPFPP